MKALPLNVAKMSSIINVQISHEVEKNAHSHSPRKINAMSDKDKNTMKNVQLNSDDRVCGSSPRATHTTSTTAPHSSSSSTAPSSSSSNTLRTIKPNPQHATLMMEASEMKLKSRRPIHTHVNRRDRKLSLSDDSVESLQGSSPVFTDRDPNSPEIVQDKLVSFVLDSPHSRNVTPLEIRSYTHKKGKLFSEINLSFEKHTLIKLMSPLHFVRFNRMIMFYCNPCVHLQLLRVFRGYILGGTGCCTGYYRRH